MDVSNKYFDCVINNNRFFILETSNKPQNHETLKKIEFILKNKLLYDSNLKDNYSNYTQQDLYKFLKDNAVQLQTHPSMGTIVENVINPPTVLPLDYDVTHEITNRLEIKDLGSLAQVNRHGKKHAEIVFAERAYQFGYQGNNDESSILYLKNLFKEIKTLSRKKIIPVKYFDGNTTEKNILDLPKKLSRKDFFKILAYENIYSNYYKEFYPFLLICFGECLKKPLNKLEEVDFPNSYIDTALIVATKKDKKEIVRLLLENGANIDFPDANGNTALSIATIQEEKEIARLLLKKGANVDRFNNREETPLIIAVRQGEKEIVNLLLENGANPNLFCGGINITALYLATLNSYADFAELLIKHGANVNLRNDSKGDTALMIAIMKNEYKIIQLLLQNKADPNIPSLVKNQNSPLHEAISKGESEVAELLLQHGANINLRNAMGNTPLMIAVVGGKKDLVRLLLKHDADANISTEVSKKSTPLQWAISKGDIDIVRLLLNQSAKIDIDKSNAEGSTPLLIAISYDQKEMVELLLEHGADPNIMNTVNQHAPLHRACHDGKTDIVKLLVQDNKTNINLRNGKGETPLLIAMKRLYPNIVRILKTQGATF